METPLLPNRNAAQSRTRVVLLVLALCGLGAVAWTACQFPADLPFPYTRVGLATLLVMLTIFWRRPRLAAALVTATSLLAAGALAWAWVAVGPAPTTTDVAPVFFEATVAMTDSRFYAHRGLDVVALHASLRRRPMRGHQTLTQKLARRLRKGRGAPAYALHAALAVALELRWGKRAIVEQYVATEDYGMGQRGVVAASRYYFHQEPAQLGLAQSAVLVGLVARAPRHWLDEETLRTARREGLQHLQRTEPSPPSLEELVPAYLSPRERGAVDSLPGSGEHVDLFGYGRSDVPTGIRRVAPLLAVQIAELFREAYFLLDLRGADHLGVYADRLVRGSATSVSAHAYGQAIDLSGFRYADGTRVLVAEHEEPATRARLMQIEDLLRTYCDVVITWRDDPLRHWDHYHCEVKAERPVP